MSNLVSTRTNMGSVLLKRVSSALVAVAFISACAAKQPSTSTETSTGPRQFETPEVATSTLAAAVEKGNIKELAAIFGPESSELYSSGDEVADSTGRRVFAELYSESHTIESREDGTKILVLGKSEWPFPVPLIKAENGKWYFDGEEGVEEFVNRRIGRNELSTIAVCSEITDAQKEYHDFDLDGDGKKQYATKMWSTPGKRDGLFWPRRPGEPQSPVGPLVATAAAEGYKRGDQPKPYHGYYYKFAAKKSKSGDRFRLIAYPANWGVSGIMTFVANERGELKQKNLGPETPEIAATLDVAKLDNSWEKVSTTEVD